MNYCYLNGKFVPLNKACVSLNDIGLLRSYAIFDIVRIYNNKPFLLDKHLNRFYKSAQFLKLKVPISKNKTTLIIQKLILKNKLLDSFVQMVLTGGETKRGLTYDYNSPNFFILNKPLKQFPLSIYQKGIKLITYNHLREFPEIKTTNYITAVWLQNLKNKKNAHEILYVYDNKILEGSMSNFFIFKKDTLITPKNNILKGITRNFVLTIAKNYFKIQERDILIKELSEIDEAFITNTTKEIMPAVKIDNLKIGNGKVGQKTTFLIELFREYIKNLTK